MTCFMIKITYILWSKSLISVYLFWNDLENTSKLLLSLRQLLNLNPEMTFTNFEISKREAEEVKILRWYYLLVLQYRFLSSYNILHFRCAFCINMKYFSAFFDRHLVFWRLIHCYLYLSTSMTWRADRMIQSTNAYREPQVFLHWPQHPCSDPLSHMPTNHC